MTTGLSVMTLEGYPLTITVNVTTGDEYPIKVISNHIRFRARTFANKVYMVTELDINPLEESLLAEFSSILKHFITDFKLTGFHSFHLNKQHFDAYVGQTFLKELCLSLGFQRLTYHKAKVLHRTSDFDSYAEGYILTESPIDFDGIQRDLNGIQTSLQKIQKMDPTAVIPGIDSRYTSYEFFYQGFEGSFVYDYESRSLSLYQGKQRVENYQLKSHQKTSTAVICLFEKISTKQRLINIFSPPRFHFDHVIQRINSGVLFKLKDHIYNELRKKYTPNEIELSFAQMKNLKKPHSSHVGPMFYQLMDMFFILNEESVVSFLDYDVAKTLFLDKVKEKVIETENNALDKYLKQ